MSLTVSAGSEKSGGRPLSLSETRGVHSGVGKEHTLSVQDLFWLRSEWLLTGLGDHWTGWRFEHRSALCKTSVLPAVSFLWLPWVLSVASIMVPQVPAEVTPECQANCIPWVSPHVPPTNRKISRAPSRARVSQIPTFSERPEMGKESKKVFPLNQPLDEVHFLSNCATLNCEFSKKQGTLFERRNEFSPSCKPLCFRCCFKFFCHYSLQSNTCWLPKPRISYRSESAMAPFVMIFCHVFFPIKPILNKFGLAWGDTVVKTDFSPCVCCDACGPLMAGGRLL